MILKTKYDIGQTVWSMEEAHTFGKLEPIGREIEEIHFNNEDGIIYKMKLSRFYVCRAFLKEKQAYPTIETLLKPLPYFAKWFPVDGEIKEGDFVWSTITNKVLSIGKANAGTARRANERGHKIAKLFLCSREVKAGDTLTGWSHKTHHIAIEEDTELFKQADITDHIFKVMGQISPYATWVKEGNEFHKDDVILEVNESAADWYEGMVWTYKPIRIRNKYGEFL